MRSKLLILAILLLSITLTGQALAATATVTPSQVPKGAYVNGPGGATDDNYYWQAMKITFAAANAIAAPAVTVTLPTGLTVANTDGDASYADEISLSWSTAGAGTFAVNATTGASSIVIDIEDLAAAAADYVWIMFPVESSSNPGVASAGYAVDFAAAGETDFTTTTGPQISYRDAGALQIITYATNLSGNNDSTATYGEQYPATAAALFSSLPDLVADLAAADIVFGNCVTAGDVDNTNDVTYTLWATTDSTLNHVDVLTSGVVRAVRTSDGANFTLNESVDGSVSTIATSGLAEGKYYFYITSSLTGDFPLARSGELYVQHYPEVKILGWDYDDNGLFDNGGTDNDDASLTLDTGLYFGYDGTLTTTARKEADIYINVDDYDDNARVYLFYSTNSGLTASSITTSGTSPSLSVAGLTGATLLADTLYENAKDTEGFIMWSWNVSPVGTSYLAANSYTLYVVACDGKHTSLLASKGTDDTDAETIAIKHSPSLTIESLAEYDSPAGGVVNIETASYDTIMLTWGKQGVSGDSDIDDSAVIEFYIAHDADANSDYASSGATTLRAAVDDLTGGVHRIATSLSEDADGKTASYYAWDLKADYEETGWYPTAADTYHLYAIIDENKSGGTARVVALGDDGKLNAAEAITTINFTNGTYAHLYDPPVGDVIVYGDQTYRMRFDAFDFDADADLGIWIVDATSLAGAATSNVAGINAAGAGNVYCLNSTTGDDAAIVALKSRTDVTYDLTVRLPSEATSRYTTDNTAAANVLTAGTYWVYIGAPTGTLYRAPGTLTLKNVSDTDDASQKNLMLTPSVFTVSKGDTTTFSVRAADQGATIDLIDAYIAVEKAYFDIVSSSTPFTDGAGTGSLIANEVINDSTNSRWILHATVFNAGTALNPANADLGTVEATFQLVSKGTTNASSATSSIYFVNEPLKGWVSKFSNDGSTVSINVQQNTAIIDPRGIIEGIVTLEGRENYNTTVTFDLRLRGSYENVADTTFYNANDADSSSPGIQYALDSEGKFTLYKVPSGKYDFVVIYDRYLAKKQAIDIESALDTLFVAFGEMLGGDCIGYTDSSGSVWPNNRISVEDVNRVSDAYLLTSATSTRWNDGTYNYKWADINEDGVVNVADLTMATGNYTGSNNDGAHPVWAKALASAANGNAGVKLSGLPGSLVAGQSYTVQVVIEDASSVCGYDVSLKYDTDALSFVSIVKGGFISGSSESFPVVGDGTVGLVNAVFGKVVSAGDGVLAEVTFTAKQSGAFDSDMLGIEDVTVVNASMLAEKLADNSAVVDATPTEFALGQNFPNPFNPTTTITFSVPEAGDVTLKIYDVLGRNIRTLAAGTYNPGNYSVVWDARDSRGSMVSAGTYFYAINAGNYHAVKRMLFLK